MDIKLKRSKKYMTLFKGRISKNKGISIQTDFNGERLYIKGKSLCVNQTSNTDITISIPYVFEDNSSRVNQISLNKEDISELISFLKLLETVLEDK